MIFLQLLVVVMLLVKSLLWGEKEVRGHYHSTGCSVALVNMLTCFSRESSSPVLESRDSG